MLVFNPNRSNLKNYDLFRQVKLTREVMQSICVNNLRDNNHYEQKIICVLSEGQRAPITVWESDRFSSRARERERRNLQLSGCEMSCKRRARVCKFNSGVCTHWLCAWIDSLTQLTSRPGLYPVYPARRAYLTHHWNKMHTAACALISPLSAL